MMDKASYKSIDGILAEALHEGKANPYSEQVFTSLRIKHCSFHDGNGSV